MNVIGLDIGTTSVCASAIDADSGVTVKIISFPNAFNVSANSYERCQDAAALCEKCISAVDELINCCSPICSIGITGQMHGIVYLDKALNAVSKLYTWQDMSGERQFRGSTYAEVLADLTGHNTASGFGLTTMFVHAQNGEIPDSAASVCTIHDFVAAKLCSLASPVMHTSDAASFGIFDIDKLEFDTAAAAKAGLHVGLLPEVTDTSRIIGTYKSIPVCVAIGDNQASFIGSVADMTNSLLINIGTGSQMSFLAKSNDAVASTELRPIDGRKLLRVGSALCGGRAFAALECFIRDTATLTGNKIESAYPFIDSYLAQAGAPSDGLCVSTRFCGTRDNPAERGAVRGISLDNFTPGHLIYGVLEGITDELHQMYTACPDAVCTKLIGSGNGLSKNPALKRIVSLRFGLELLTPAHEEEACYGAALYSLAACGYYPSLEQAQKLIRYK